MQVLLNRLNMNKQIDLKDSKGSVDKNWWRGAIIYQIYPRSYQDTSGDGTGDLLGIVNRLPYIASLGVDAIWISPFFKSPMKDFGYDVSDYCDVDPMFGSLADFDQLIETAHHLNIKVIIDQVLSHTSDQHEWFKESRQSLDNDKADWFVWADPKLDGTPPNNWLSIFGGSAWQWDSGRQQYYLHNFLTCQPDLNFHNIEVQDAVLNTTKFWLDRGVDGFRLDTINFYFADKELRDNPPLNPEDRNGSIAPIVNPYNHQRHIYSKNQPENLAFLERFRSLLDEYPAVTAVGEVGDAQFGLELVGEYTKGDNRVHMCYSFEFLSTEKLVASRLRDIFSRMSEVAADGWPCWALTNHDIKRHTTRWSLDSDGERLYALLLMCLRGSVCLYQGEELGLPEAEIEFKDLQDPYGIEFWPNFKGRDGCRTPMVWQTDKPNGGFSNVKPWLPVSAEHVELSVEVQEKNRDSLLHFYRKIIAFRKDNPSLIHGGQSAINVNESIASFSRFNNDSTDDEIFCAFNFGDDEVNLKLPAGEWQAIGLELGCIDITSKGSLIVPPLKAVVAKKLKNVS